MWTVARLVAYPVNMPKDMQIEHMADAVRQRPVVARCEAHQFGFQPFADAKRGQLRGALVAHSSGRFGYFSRLWQLDLSTFDSLEVVDERLHR